ncbi:MAG: PAS domain S-box protein [Candidatus Sigynarchaeota archaeon]
MVDSQKRLTLLAELLELSSQPFAVGYPDGHFGPCNEAFCKLTGYSKQEMMTLDWTKITPSEWLDNEREMLKTLEATGEPVRYEKEYIRKDGTRVPISLFVHLVRDESHQPVYYYAFVTDISERKAAEEEIHFRSLLLDSVTDSVFVYDMEGNFFFVNETACKSLGYSRAELMKINHYQLETPEYSKMLRHRIETLRHNTRDVFESAHLRKDGTIMPVEVHARIIKWRERDFVLSVCIDITDRKKHEEMLKNTLAELTLERDKARQFVNIAGTMLVALDVNGNITLINKKGCEILGVKQEEALGLNWFDNFLPQKDKETIKEMHRAYMIGQVQGEFRPHDNPVRTRMGIERMISWHNVILRDSTGNIIGTLSSGEDITERELVKAKLVAQKSTLEGIMESSDSPIFSVDAKYCYTSFNKSHADRMKAIYGVTIELGKSILDYQTIEADRVETKKIIDRVLQGERVVTEAFSGEKGLPRACFIVSHNPIRDVDGNVIGVAVSARDVTAEKLAQEKIEFMARFPTENPNPVLRVTTNGKILYANNKGEKILKSWNCSVQDRIPDFLRKEIEHAWHTKIPQTVEVPALDRVYSIVMVPISGLNYVNLYGMDITDLKLAQRVLNRLNEELEARVEERTRALKDAQERMMRQEKLASIGKLAGSIGHELRNPLCVIANSVYFLGSKLVSADEKIKKHLAIIKEQSDRANATITQLLDFARTKPEDINDIDIAGFLNDLLNHLSIPKKIKVSTEYQATLPKISSDPNKLRQALQNIITNAIQAMHDGGTLSITTRLNEDKIEIAITDTGEGIAEENFPRLFEPLFSTKVKGIGLGLSITKEIVEGMKGKIDVTSKVGVGSTFTIKLPVKNGN